MTTHPIEILAKAIADKQSAALATVVEVKGASPAKVGAQILLLEDGTTAGTVGGGNLESAILEDARLALTESCRAFPNISSPKRGRTPSGRCAEGRCASSSSPFCPRRS